MKKTITVCIPTCLNNIEFFVELLRSISRQTMLPDQIMVICSGKNKNRKIFEKLIDKLDKLIPKNINPEFIIVDNFGLSVARNIGVDLCKTDILIFGDDDDIWDKDKIYLLNQTFQKNGICLVRHDFKNLIKDKIKNSPVIYKFVPNIFLMGIANYAGGGSAISGSTCIFKTIRFNEKLFGCEDWDFWIRSYLAGIPIININKRLVTYRTHPNRMTKSLTNVFSYEGFVRFKYLKKISIFFFGLILGFLRQLLKYILIIFPYFILQKLKRNNYTNREKS